jgi:hypothetical protein
MMFTDPRLARGGSRGYCALNFGREVLIPAVSRPRLDK